MGFKAIDVTPISSLGPTPLIPGAKTVYEKMIQIARTDTVSTLKAQLPGDASLVGLVFFGSTSSDALTTATATFTVSNNSGVVTTGVVDVKGAGTVTALMQMSNLPNIEVFPLLGDLRVSVVYAETGTASTVGGPWKVVLRYVR